MIWIVLLLCLGLVKCQTVDQTEDELMFAQVIFRHGDRTIRKTFATDPYKDKVHWPEGWGQLTNLGKQQQYELGKYFRRRYAKLLGDGSYSPDKVFTVSSALDRTINSASLVLAGLFPPQQNQVWNQEIFWQPIPVYSIPQSEDYLIKADDVCPLYEKLLKEYENSPEVQAVIERNQELFEYLEKHAGQPIRDLEQLKDLHGTFIVEHSMNKTIPDWAQTVFTPGGDFEYLAEYWLKFTSGTNQLKRLKSGFLLKEILDRFKNKTVSVLSSNHSLRLYSGHDTTIANMLNSLGLFHPHIPPYSSSLLFELYKSNDDFYVQLFYRNNLTEDPSPLNIPLCGTKCPLNRFYDLYNAILPSDFGTECHLPTEKLSHRNRRRVNHDKKGHQNP
ncbi:prostatic acid phosphatase-like isoform X2 [Sitodiplosis mosellana]|nr:prostatic acid phosphatase-like isoform X2 [Sitodiplosis mosellana]XP_055300678.1 prostatic acid phosphatase-like isoform X2 [Sitodiplosis mosellana]XP_055300679.1 prostatic acid phosphatase-like isoform X2 [Sitodiplosis mosellana]